MNYSPIWSSIVNSSLWREAYHVRILFASMLAVKDRNFMVYGDSYKLSTLANITEEEAIDAIRVLSSPDTKRIAPQEYGGRRIEAVDGGWLILNARKYRDMMRKQYKLQWQRDNRAKKSGKPSTVSRAAQERDSKRRATGEDRAAREAFVRVAGEP